MASGWGSVVPRIDPIALWQNIRGRQGQPAAPTPVASPFSPNWGPPKAPHQQQQQTYAAAPTVPPVATPSWPPQGSSMPAGTFTTPPAYQVPQPQMAFNFPSPVSQVLGLTGNLPQAAGSVAYSPSQLGAPPAALEMSVGDASAALQSMRAQFLNNLNNALSVGAATAASTYDVKLGLLDDEIERVQGAQAVVNGLWNGWRDRAVNVIGINAEKAQVAYNQYQQLVKKGYNQYIAETKSGWRQYRQTVQSLISEYITQTNESYEQLMVHIPKFWRNVVDAVAQGDEQAIAAVRKGEVTEVAGIAASVAAASVSFRTAARTIGNTDPALEAEVMGDLQDVAAIAVEQARYEGVWGERIQKAVTDLSIKAARYQVASRLQAVELERVQSVNDAEYQKLQLLASSGYQQMQQTMEAQGAKANAMIAIESNAYQQAEQFEQQRQQIVTTAEETAKQIEFELAEQLRALQIQVVATTADRQQAVDLQTQAIYNQYATSDAFNVTQSEYAVAYMNDRIREAMLLNGGTFNELDWQRISEDVFAFYQGTAQEGLAPVRTYEEFLAVIEDQQLAANLARRDLAQDLATNPDYSLDRVRTATNLGIFGASDAPFDPETKRFGTMSVADSARLMTALSYQAQEQLRLNGDWPTRPSTRDMQLYEVAFSSMGQGMDQWNTDQGLFQGGNMAWPLPGVIWNGQSNYGEYRQYYNNGEGGTHGGTDINAPAGTPILALLGGTVVDVRFEAQGGGHVVEILGLDGRRYIYMHMQTTPNVAINDQIGAGTVLGAVGHTGNASVDHLHLSITEVGSTQRVDPTPFLLSLFGG